MMELFGSIMNNVSSKNNVGRIILLERLSDLLYFAQKYHELPIKLKFTNILTQQIFYLEFVLKNLK